MMVTQSRDAPKINIEPYTKTYLEVVPTMSRNILITNPTLHPNAKKRLEELGFQVFVAQNPSEDALIHQINVHKIVGMFVRIEKITGRIFDSCPSLQIVVENGIGVDNIDVAAATRNGVKVANLSLGALAVAEHTIAFIMALGRDLRWNDITTRAGQWKSFNQPSFNSVQIMGSKLLIVGTGNIGQQVAKRAGALGMELLGYDPFLSQDRMAAVGLRKMETLEDGLAEADFVSVHMPLTDQTRGMFSTQQFKQMKNSAFFINVGRGPIVHEQALYQALKNHEIAGAALDVFEKEPTPADNPLFQIENLLVSAHVAGTHKTLMADQAILGAESIAEAVDGGGRFALNVVNQSQLNAQNTK